MIVVETVMTIRILFVELVGEGVITTESLKNYSGGGERKNAAVGRDTQ